VEQNTLKIFTDGGCSGNGTVSAIAGIGVYFGENDPRNMSKRIIGVQTNNRAELSAIIEALRVILNFEGVVSICTDSEYSIKGITGVNKIKKNKDLFQEINVLLGLRRGKTEFKKVLAHSGSKDGNYHADLLATKAIDNT
jgi:ribonuclease HI